MEIISQKDNEQEFFIDGLLDLNKIEKTDFTLKEDENFRTSLYKDIKRMFSRENILKFGIITGEVPVKIEDTTGNVSLSTVNKDQISKRIKTFSETDRKKIKFVHVSTCQIIIKSTFMKNIDTPIDLILRDSRIINHQESIIAKGKCNLSAGKIKFDVNLQLGLSLTDKDLDQSIILEFKLLKPNFMKEGNSPFSICYRINYALSNSHHSIEFRHAEKIHIDELFTPVLELESSSILKPVEFNSRLMRISSMREISTTIPQIERPRSSLQIKPPALVYNEDREVQKLKETVLDLSGKIDNLNQRIYCQVPLGIVL